MSHTATVSTVSINNEGYLRRAVEALQARGLNVELVENERPDLYYENQIQMHLKDAGAKFQFHDDVEECDFVLKVHDAYYDIGFLKNDKGELVPLFDDYNYFGHSKRGSCPIRDILGADFDAPVEHWSGERADTEQAQHSIGKLLQEYSKQAALGLVAESGYMVMGEETDKDGFINIEVEV